MPVRSLSSCVLKWPDAQTVHASMLQWARTVTERGGDVVAVGYIGSYARGDWSVGSDVDIIVVRKECPVPWIARSADYDTRHLPVPADVLVYSLDEWRRTEGRGRFGRTLREEVVWVWGRPEAG